MQYFIFTAKEKLLCDIVLEIFQSTERITNFVSKQKTSQEDNYFLFHHNY